jgi:Icc-related predicted phosphoesterase
MAFFKKSRESQTKIFFATDLHGSDRCFRKFVNAGKHYGVDHIIIGGDLTGKVLVPIEKRPTGYAADFGDHHYVDMTEEECRSLKKLIRDKGSYYIVGTHDDLMELTDEVASEKAFRRAAEAAAAEWVQLAEERLRGSGIRCFITPGNDDSPEIDDVLSASDVVEFVEGRVVALDDNYQMLTTGYANPTPWHSPRELSEEMLESRIDAMFFRASPDLKTIAVLHVPPYDSTLDQAPVVKEVNGEVHVQTSAGSTLMGAAGSRAVRSVIERHQPMLSLHGHIHESKGVERIGKTVCINPGSEYHSGVLTSVILSLSGDDVRYQFVNG